MSQFNYDDAVFGIDESADRLRKLIQSHKSLSLKIRQELWDIIHNIDACSGYFHEELWDIIHNIEIEQN